MGKLIFHNLYMVKKILQNDFNGKHGIKTRNKDRCVVISGAVGLGKSNLLLHMHDFWLTEILKREITPEDIKFVGSNKIEWLKALDEAQKYNRKYQMVSHDEAGKDLYSRNASSKFTKDINIAYQVIRGSNMYSILVIPSITNLDTYFRRERVTDLYHVYAEGKVAYYSKKELGWLLPAMERMAKANARPDPMRAKTVSGRTIRPRFFDDFPLYKGALLKPYMDRKKGNMKGTVKDLVNKYTEKVNKTVTMAEKYHKQVKQMIKKGMKKKEIAEKLGVTTRTVYNAEHWGEK